MNIPENILSNLTEEQKKKVEEAKNPEELLALAKEAGQDLTPEQLEVELKKTDSIVKVSDQIIRNGELAFHTMQHLDSHGYNSDNRKIPPMLIDGGEW